MVVGAKVCDLTEDLLWFVCGFDVFPKVFSFRKVQEVSLCRILFIVLAGLAYDLMFSCQYFQKQLHQVC